MDRFYSHLHAYIKHSPKLDRGLSNGGRYSVLHTNLVSISRSDQCIGFMRMSRLFNVYKFVPVVD